MPSSSSKDAMKFVTVGLTVFGLLCISTQFMSANSQHFGAGPCPKVTPMKNFNVSAYAGLWHEVEKYWFLFEATASCVRVQYFDNQTDDGSFGVLINMYDNVLRTTHTNPGLTRFLSNDGSAELILDVEITQSPIPFVVKYPYFVLGTDYTSYTIKWTCMNTGPMNMQSLWILSRTKTLPPKSRKIIYNTLKSMGISTNSIRKSDPNTCA